MFKSDKALIHTILDEIDFIISKTSDISEVQYSKDKTLQKALIQCFLVIGEATKGVSSETKKKYKNIQWREMAGMRDKLIHRYFEIDYATVWDTSKNNIPGLKTLLEKIIKDPKIP